MIGCHDAVEHGTGLCHNDHFARLHFLRCCGDVCCVWLKDAKGRLRNVPHTRSGNVHFIIIIIFFFYFFFPFFFVFFSFFLILILYFYFFQIYLFLLLFCFCSLSLFASLRIMGCICGGGRHVFVQSHVRYKKICAHKCDFPQN